MGEVRDRRGNARLHQVVPVVVEGLGPDGRPWREETTTYDLSARGASLRLHQRVAPGEAVMARLEVPDLLRARRRGQETLHAVGAVTSVQPLHEARDSRVGIRFLVHQWEPEEDEP